MSYAIPANAPQITINGRTLCIAGIEQNNAMGVIFTVGIFEKQKDGAWWSAGTAAVYANDGDCLLDIKAKGGTMLYIKWLKEKLTELFRVLFPSATVPTGAELTTEAQARAFVAQAVAGMILANVNGTVTL